MTAPDTAPDTSPDTAPDNAPDTNQRRASAITMLSEMIMPESLVYNLSRFPRLEQDPDGTEFDGYFKFLQMVALCREEDFVDELTPKELELLASDAQRYHYQSSLLTQLLIPA